jgi:hypothetical protein
VGEINWELTDVKIICHKDNHQPEITYRYLESIKYKRDVQFKTPYFHNASEKFDVYLIYYKNENATIKRI